MKINSLQQAFKWQQIFDLYGTDFRKIIKHPNLPIDFIQKYFWRLKPFKLEYFQQNLPSWFIDKYQNSLNWQLLSKYQQLSQEQIERHKRFVNWKAVALKQNISEQFIERNSDLLDFEMLKFNPNLNPTILQHVRYLFVDQQSNQDGI